jgi:hypothetical protein
MDNDRRSALHRRRMSNKFNIGDVVKWTSKAGGHALEKSGSVIEIVPAGSTPKANLGHHAGGSPRAIESYIVAVPQKSKSTSPRPMKPKLYWPHVGVLEKLEGSAEESADEEGARFGRIGSSAQFAEAAVQQMAADGPSAVS